MNTTDTQRHLVREVVDQIELVRLKRRDQWRDGGHPDCKRFTHEEISNLACGVANSRARDRMLHRSRMTSPLPCSILSHQFAIAADRHVPAETDPCPGHSWCVTPQPPFV